MHVSNMLRATMITGALATGGAAAGIAGASAATTSSTATTPAPSTTAPAPAPKGTAPKAGSGSEHPCPNMGSKPKGGAYTGPGESSSSGADYAIPGPPVSYQ